MHKSNRLFKRGGHYAPLFLFSLILLASCMQKPKREVPWQTEEEVETTSATQERDAEDNEEVEREFTPKAMSADEFQAEINILQRQVQRIKSPDMLLSCIQDVEEQLGQLQANMKAMNNPSARDELRQLQTQWADVLGQYTMPANGVIQNLDQLLQSAKNAKSEADFQQIVQSRKSFLRNLPHLHAIIQEKNRRREVQHKANQLHQMLAPYLQ